MFSDVFDITVLVGVYPLWFLLNCFGFHIYNTISWSLIPTAVVTDVMRSGLVVQTRSNVVSYLVGL